MHMADALLSPAVGGTMWAVSGGVLAYSAKKVKEETDDRKAPLMGVLGAFIFAAQMINFSIPGTGSSGHLGGGMILAILLGPWRAFIVMASVLTVQAFFFADGGLLALGCNIFNMGFFTCFLAYPFIYRKIAGNKPSKGRIAAGSVFASLAGLQLGAFGVVLATSASGISELPFKTFVVLMQPIHLAIGLIEGFVTAGIVSVVMQAKPEIFSEELGKNESREIKKLLLGFAAAAVFTGAVFSWFASSDPDGLEWAIMKTSGKEEVGNTGKLHSWLSFIQSKTTFLPDYDFKKAEKDSLENAPASWLAPKSGTSVSGLAGGVLTLALAGLAGFWLRGRKTGKERTAPEKSVA